jgi:hypothetical protein
VHRKAESVQLRPFADVGLGLLGLIGLAFKGREDGLPLWELPVALVVLILVVGSIAKAISIWQERRGGPIPVVRSGQVSAPHPARATRSAPALIATFEMRPKQIWGWLNAAIAIWSAVEAVAKGGWFFIVAAAFYGLMAMFAFRSYIRVEGGVLYRRALWGWYPPLDLQRLTSVGLTRTFAAKEPYPHLELSLADEDGHEQSLSLRWWSNWPELATAVARSVSDTSSDDQQRREWLLDLDPKTRTRLQHFL